MKSLGLTLALLLFAGVVAEGQILKRLGKRVKRKVEERVERKTDEAVDKGLDKVEDAAEGKDGEKEGPGAAGDDQSGKDGKNAGLETAKDTGNTAAAVGLSVQQNPGVKVQIIGHTDADGSEELNLKLSQDRAASVKAALTSEFGIAAERMVTGGKGESVPVAGNDTSEGKAKNRRVEFVKR